MKKAYSYIRFSRSHQAEGDSLERQEAAAVKYCEEHGFELDRSTYHDLGVSAFHSRNRKTGALGRFLEACEAGKIEAGSALIIESLDRLSRDTPWESIGLLKTLLDHGIETHVMYDRLVLRPEDSGGTDLMLITMLASRAHEESRTKSRRLLSAFAKKRETALETGGIIAPTLPWFLEFSKTADGKTKIICPATRRKIVLRIFKETASGKSSQKIAEALNKDEIPTWRAKQKRWVAARVRDLVRSSSPLGTLSATSKTVAAGRQHSIEGYYPRVVSDELAEEARATLARNKTQDLAASTGRPNAGKRPINLLRGLLRHRGSWMRHMTHQNGKDGGYNSYYEAVDQLTGKFIFSVPGRQLEPLLLAGICELSSDDLAPVTPQTPKRVVLQKQAAALNEKISNIVSAIESGSKALGRRLAELETELARVETEIEKTDEVVPPDAAGLKRLKTLALDGLTVPETRALIAEQLARLIQRIEVDSDLNGLALPESFWPKLHQGALAISDPTPKRCRKPLVILITFRAGGQRLIIRDNSILGVESYRLHERKEMPGPPPRFDSKVIKRLGIPSERDEAISEREWFESRFPRDKSADISTVTHAKGKRL